MEGMRISSKEFRISNVSKKILQDTIEKAIAKMLGTQAFHIKKSGIKESTIDKANLVNIYFTAIKQESCKILKDTWSICIDNVRYRLTPAYFAPGDLEKRKAFRGEFFGFDPDHNTEKVMEVLQAHDPRHTF
ncbi:hypothetical protein RclHR1_18910003 [Rhizophagus clarus]|uniref:Uncharacterized protein n=1 Tax=Rhizophagus clarus TaxID=94130 RepID=A0A2Z6QN70_9GLOM|nr:hypothetical protein RclHR1_18910003 [Rhizophagus clarus]